jgi:hypothetical protein
VIAAGPEISLPAHLCFRVIFCFDVATFNLKVAKDESAINLQQRSDVLCRTPEGRDGPARNAEDRSAATEG